MEGSAKTSAQQNHSACFMQIKCVVLSHWFLRSFHLSHFSYDANKNSDSNNELEQPLGHVL